MECEALKKVRDEMGLTNVEIMVPFVRTVGQAARVVDLLAAHGLARGENGLKLIMMCEVPSNAILADEFLQYFDGFRSEEHTSELQSIMRISNAVVCLKKKTTNVK